MVLHCSTLLYYSLADLASSLTRSSREPLPPTPLSFLSVRPLLTTFRSTQGRHHALPHLPPPLVWRLTKEHSTPCLDDDEQRERGSSPDQ